MSFALSTTIFNFIVLRAGVWICIQYTLVSCGTRRTMLRVKKLVTESFEAVLHICNATLKNFGPIRIQDMLSQILPTAYFLDTGFWPFYRTENGRNVCICDIFNLECIHSSYSPSSINVEGFMDESRYLRSQGSRIELIELEVDVSIPDNFNHVNIFVKYRVKQTRYYGNHQRERILKTTFITEFGCKVIHLSNFCLSCSPHPVKSVLYNNYFECLGLEGNVIFPMQKVMEWNKCPDHTIIVDSVLTRDLVFACINCCSIESDDEEDVLDLTLNQFDDQDFFVRNNLG